MSRSARAVAAGAVVAVVVAVVLVGGVLRTGSQSASYVRAVNRSFAEETAVLAARSNATGRQLRRAVPSMAGTSRRALDALLDTLVDQARSVARQAALFESPAPSGGAGADVAQAFAERAGALVHLRRTLDRLLTLSPLPAVKSADPSAAVAPTPPHLSTAGATAALQRVGDAVAASNRAYASARRALHDAPGKARLAASSWTSGTAWSATGAASLVAALRASPSLAAVHDVVLDTGALAITPSPVPPPAGSPPSSSLEVPPTSRLSVSAVVADRGNVPARGVTVSLEVASQTGAAPTRRSRTVSLAPGGATTVLLPPAPVTPAGHYSVTVTVTPAAADTVAGAVTSATLSVTVGPPSPPSVTAVKPKKGPAAGGTAVVIIGTGFRHATVVKFGTADARFTIVSGTEIKAIAPPGTGTVIVTVENAGGPSGFSATHQFTYKGSGPAGPSGTTTTTTTSAGG